MEILLAEVKCKRRPLIYILFQKTFNWHRAPAAVRNIYMSHVSLLNIKSSTSSLTYEKVLLLLQVLFNIIGIQPLGQFGQRPELSQGTGIALVRCILGKFLRVGCHYFQVYPWEIAEPGYFHVFLCSYLFLNRPILRKTIKAWKRKRKIRFYYMAVFFLNYLSFCLSFHFHVTQCHATQYLNSIRIREFKVTLTKYIKNKFKNKYTIKKKKIRVRGLPNAGYPSCDLKHHTEVCKPWIPWPSCVETLGLLLQAWH
jgi:hypothetical protein